MAACAALSLACADAVLPALPERGVDVKLAGSAVHGLHAGGADIRQGPKRRAEERDVNGAHPARLSTPAFLLVLQTRCCQPHKLRWAYQNPCSPLALLLQYVLYGIFPVIIGGMGINAAHVWWVMRPAKRFVELADRTADVRAVRRVHVFSEVGARVGGIRRGPPCMLDSQAGGRLGSLALAGGPSFCPAVTLQCVAYTHSHNVCLPSHTVYVCTCWLPPTTPPARSVTRLRCCRE